MMKAKIIGILVSMLVIATALPAVGTQISTEKNSTHHILGRGVEWNLTYDLGEFDEFRNVIQTMPDKGYITCGLTEESDNYYVWLLKLDTDGNEEWHVVNHDLNGTILTQTDMDVRAFDIIQTTDGGYLITGTSVIYVDVQGEYVWVQAGYLWKTDATGTTEWTQHYYDVEELAVDILFDSIELSEGYATTGFRAYFNESGYVIALAGCLIQTDTDGNVLWHEIYEGGGDDYLTSLCDTSDGGYLITGWVDTTTVANGALWMIKTNDTGVKQWECIFDGPELEYTFGKGCFETTDGGYIMAGNTASYGAGMVDTWVIKTDASGHEIWNQTFGFTHNDYTWAMDQTTDGTYCLAIVKDYHTAGGTKDDIWVVEFNEAGETEWSHLIEQNEKQLVSSIQHTDDHGFIVSGRSNEYGISNSDGLLYKIAAFPHLDIAISGGIGVTATITNNGFGDAIDVPYEIVITGGFLGMINKTISDTVDVVSGGTATVKSGLFFGFGPIQINMTIGPEILSENKFQFLILTL